jgi:nucleoside-diphosphate-sugar epimerase
MRVLVTGNKGYIGSVLCKELLREGMEAIGLDTDFYRGCGFLQHGYRIKEICKDIRQITKEDLSGVDSVIHLAALSNDPMGALNPELTSKINYMASVNLARISREAKVKRFIFSSSCSVYGISDNEPIDENGILDPVTEYAKSKVETEYEIARLANNDFSPVFLRNATVYGVSPMLRVDLVVNNLAGWAFTTGKIRVMSDGSPWRPLIHVKDVSRAFIACLKAPRQLIHNQVFNVGENSENYRIRDIVSMIKKVMPDCSIEYTGEHGADTRNYRVNFNKFSGTLTNYFNPQWNIEIGINELLSAYKSNEFTFEILLEQNKLDKNLFWREGGKR